ncbi:uncharacterized protein HD556DRAFT_1460944 [Suillus plorans]|uniref:Uncharacterized protein n=1 Tax=Suillus plorans TaxID=116603 RepID=A0A9P7A9P1_9AGAM|nr:uncharacterized protein HD556DRAFT_1460944 [Suillus plorans]KAG1785003.1 hypothetical protein HD556DRAFT_1460944 [Suillus plorans]
MWGAQRMHFKDGVRIEVDVRTRRLDVLASAGRMDPISAFAVRIALEKIAMALRAFQSTSVKALVKEQRSFGFWSPRRNIICYLSSTHTVRREQAAFKADRSAVSRQYLVGWLQRQIAEQKRVDLATSGSSVYPDTHTIPAPSKDASAPEVKPIPPVDTKKQKKHIKQILLDRGNANYTCNFKSTNVCSAYEKAGHLKTAVQNGLPMLAVDVPNAVFDTL